MPWSHCDFLLHLPETFTLEPSIRCRKFAHISKHSHFFSIFKSIRKITEKRMYHPSPMQTEKSQPEGERIMPETRFTEFPALSVDPRVGISRSALETDV